MRKRKCKICDNELAIGDYCPVCKQLVSTYEIEQNYYLNESRHEARAEEANGTYHPQNLKEPDDTLPPFESQELQRSEETWGSLPSIRAMSRRGIIILVCLAAAAFLLLLCKH